VTDSRRKAAIRAVMAETGMKYMAAMRELDRRNTEQDAARQLAEHQADQESREQA
jgi:hypothetical protein